jgi:hypothetical protein
MSAHPDGSVNVVHNGTGQVTVSGVPNGATVNCTGSGPQTIDLDRPDRRRIRSPSTTTALARST